MYLRVALRNRSEPILLTHFEIPEKLTWPPIYLQLRLRLTDAVC